MNFLRRGAIALCALLAACSADSISPQPNPAVVQSSDRYIVQLKSDAPRGLAAKLAGTIGVTPTHLYEKSIKGFAARLSPDRVEALRLHPAVLRVEADARATISLESQPITTSGLWGLDRVDQRSLPLDAVYQYESQGAGVHVYIVDTGIDTNHVEFGGRAGGGTTFVFDGFGTWDCNRHGTHVAGIVGGATVGVAKQVTLHPVRVLDCGGSGWWSDIIAGVDWVTANAQRPAVLNMSLGGSAYQSVNDAVAGAVTAGVAVAVAAGNSYGADACGYSPASTPNVLTVASSASNDWGSNFSNIGPCVDLFAPGSGVYSAVPDGAYATLNGTSMATPHVAGALALALGMHPEESGAQAMERVRAATTVGALKNSTGGTFPNGTVNKLLYTLGLGEGSAPTPPPPPTSVLTISPSTVSLSTTQDGGPASITLNVSNPAGLSGTTVQEDAAWLQYVFSGPYLALSADPAGLAIGTYTTTVVVTQPSATNSPVLVPVTFTVRGVTDVPPVASFQARCVSLRCDLNASASSDDKGITQYAWSTSDGQQWTSESPLSSVTFNRTGKVTITLRVTDTAGQSSAPVSKQVNLRRK